MKKTTLLLVLSALGIASCGVTPSTSETPSTNPDTQGSTNTTTSTLVSTEEEEEYVFVTKTGTSYHENRGCSYLNPSIHLVAAADMDEQRNESGGKYYPCSLCATEQGAALYYVTDYGTSYHCSTACSGLKRTIYEIKRSETGGRTACSKCSRG